MVTKRKIVESIKTQFASAREHGRVLSQALKVRADIAATRRRLRSTFADLGEEVYAKIKAGKPKGLAEDAELAVYRTRIEGLEAEMQQREGALKEILAGRKKKGEGEEPEKVGKPGGKPAAGNSADQE